MSDNAANILKAVKLTGFNHLPCVAHTVNLVVQDALKSPIIVPVHHKAKNIVDFFHRSTVAASKFTSYQRQMRPDKVPLKLVNDVKTRWNSSYMMLERLLKVQEPLEAAMGVLRTDLVLLTPEDWTTIADLCLILKPFAQITAELSAEKNVSASKVINNN